MMICSTCRGETRFDWRTHRWTHREVSDHDIFPVVPVTPEESNTEPEQEIPEPEVRSTPRSIEDLPPRSGMRQIANLISGLDNWTILGITYARGPYLSAAGKLLSISDSIVIRAVTLDKHQGVVASWRDAKFDFAYTRVGKEGWRKMTSTELKTFIKEAP